MLSNEQFQLKLKEVGKVITTDTIYNGNNTVMDCTCIYGHRFKTKAFNLIYNKNGCPVCSGRQINIGFNDMWTTNPELASLLKNPKDGYKYSQSSDKKVWWVCPCCKESHYKTISTVKSRGLSCNKCSDGISFPNRFMYNVLSQLNVEFKTEYIINGANYRYDFYIPQYNLIIEMQGKQHYEGWNSKRKTKEEIQENDKNKRNYAISSGIKFYVEIDCKETTKNHIMNSILKSQLVDFYDFNTINWNKCCLDSVKSFVYISANHYNNGMSVNDIAITLGFCYSTILKWLKIATDLKICRWIPSIGFLNDEKPVILINDKKIYNSLSDASRDSGQCVQNISEACSGNRSYCGFKNGKPLIWMFLDDYQNENIKNKSTNVYLLHNNGIKINQYSIDGVYINTFNSIKEAKMITGITTIINACLKKKYSAGSYRWYYIDDENQPDKSKIEGNPRYYGEDKKYFGKAKRYNELLNNEYSSIIIDSYDRYGNFLKTYIGYNEASKDTNCSKESIYTCCSGNSAYADKYVFRYNGENFNKYFYPELFSTYINVYDKESKNFVGTYYSLQEAARQLGFSGTSSAYKALRKERKYAYGYSFYYVNDKGQPDKTRIVS